MVNKVYFNGRFLSQRLTGVQRYALETLRALDRLIARGEGAAGLRYELLAPPDAELPALQAIQPRQVGPLRGVAWEQSTLAWASRDGLLWGFGPTGPLLVKNQGVTIHDATVRAIPHSYSWKFRTYYELALPWLAQRARQVMTVSEFSRGEVGAWLGVDAQRLLVSGEGWQHVSNVAPDLRVLERLGLRARAYVLAVSSVTPHKNFSVIARAIEQLQDRRVVIAGEVDEKVFGSVAGSSLRGVTLAGRVSDGELRALYENAGVFVFPSLYEGFGLPPLEAMAHGCPVIASNAASMPEVCADGAWYFEPHDVPQLVTLIQTLMSDEEQRRSLILKGKARLGAHSWEAAARVHLSAIGVALAAQDRQARP